MYLLNVHTRELEMFETTSVPSYAILSHTWGEDEVSFQDLSCPDHKQKQGYSKIEGCCQRAIRDGLEHVWIDTCCIDKRSSAELSEAINSMFVWYERARVCYAYLADVSSGQDPYERGSAFRKSRWFSRGWTLQELIAPPLVEFFDSTWAPISDVTKRTKSESSVSAVTELLTSITGIRREILNNTYHHANLRKVPVAEILSWASQRQTTRAEDIAYCLLGLLNVNMPLLYGEGHKAFARLEEEFIKQKDDLSILAWGYGLPSFIWEIEAPQELNPLASTPFLFREFGEISWPLANPSLDLREYTGVEWEFLKHLMHNQSRSPWTVTNHGLHIELPLLCLDPWHNIYLGILTVLPNRGVARQFVGVPLERRENTDVFERLSGSPPLKLALNMTSSSIPFFGREQLKWVRIHFIRETVRDISPFARLRMNYHCLSPIVFARIANVTGAGFTVHSFYPPVISIALPSHVFYYGSRKNDGTNHEFILCFSRRDGVCFAFRIVSSLQGSSGKRRFTAWLAHTDTRSSALELYGGCQKSNCPGIKDPPKLLWTQALTFSHRKDDSLRTERFSLKWATGDDKYPNVPNVKDCTRCYMELQVVDTVYNHRDTN